MFTLCLLLGTLCDLANVLLLSCAQALLERYPLGQREVSQEPPPSLVSMDQPSLVGLLGVCQLLGVLTEKGLVRGVPMHRVPIYYLLLLYLTMLFVCVGTKGV